jgi:hypothetical protein
MPRSSMIVNQGVTERFSDAIAKLRSPGDFVTVIRGVPRSIIMSCPDGCGETLTVNLDGRAGPAWRTYQRGGRLTVYPSVWRESGCKAHFIIWRDRIIWCGPNERVEARERNHALEEMVYAHISAQSFVHYEQIAEQLDQIPWEVNWSCHDLVRMGMASEGEVGTFRRIDEKGALHQKVD